MTSIADTSSGSTLVEALQGGDVELPALTTSTGNVTYQTDSSTSNTIDLPLLASLTNGTLNDAGGTVTVPVLTTASGANFYVSNGLTLNLPELTSYTQPNGCCYTGTLEATGTGSVLSMPELTSIANTSSGSTLVEALSGGKVELPALNQVTGSNVTLESSGSGSALTGATGNAPATATASAANFEVSGGATLSLPRALASYTQPVGCCYTGTLEATGTGSLLSLTGLTSIADTSSGSTLVEALAGGDVELPLLAQISGSISFQSTGTGSLLNLSSLQSLTSNGGSQSLTITQGGTVLDPDLATLASVTITTDSTGTFTLPASQTFSFPSGTTTISTGTFVDEGDASVQNSAALNVKGGLTINGQGGLSVAANATLDVSGSLLGNTTNAAAFNVAGTVVLRRQRARAARRSSWRPCRRIWATSRPGSPRTSPTTHSP